MDKTLTTLYPVNFLDDKFVESSWGLTVKMTTCSRRWYIHARTSEKTYQDVSSHQKSWDHFLATPLNFEVTLRMIYLKHIQYTWHIACKCIFSVPSVLSGNWKKYCCKYKQNCRWSNYKSKYFTASRRKYAAILKY